MSPTQVLSLLVLAPCLCFCQTSPTQPYLAGRQLQGASPAHTPSGLTSLRQKIAQAKASRAPRTPASFLGELQTGRARNAKALATGSIAGSPQTSFLTMQDTGYLPTATVTGDFNGDGKMDWATAMGGDDTIWIYLGNGDGTWKIPEILTLKGSGPIGLAAADLRHMGRSDLIVAETNSGTVGVLLSNGDSSFQPETEFALPSYPESITTGDFNGDGNVDVIVGNNIDAAIGPVTFLPGDGTGELGTPVHGKAGNSLGAISLAAADFNGDGKLDLMISEDPGGGDFVGAQVELGNGDGTFTAEQLLQIDSSSLGGTSIITAAPVADIDHDGCIDAVTVDIDGMGRFYKGNCDGTFQTNFPFFSMGDSLVSAELVDVNGDGNLDIVGGGSQQFSPSTIGANSGNLVVVSLGDGKGGFSTDATVYRAGTDLYAFSAADLHNSGKPDLIAPSMYASTLTVLANDGQGHFHAPSGSALGYGGGGPLNASISVPVVLDLNGDGLPDLAILRGPDYAGDPSTLFVIPQQPNGTFQTPLSSDFIPNTYNPYVPSVFAFGNFRGHGAQDAIALSYMAASPFLYFAPNDGKGNFGAGTMTTPPAANGQVGVGDFNGDGKLDFVAAGTSGDVPSLTTFLGNGDGTFTAQSTSMLPNSTSGQHGYIPDAVFVGDFNRDGNLDVLAHYQSDATSAMLFEAFGDGKGGFTSSTEIAAQIPYIFTADLNHDGCPDIVAADSDTSRPGFSVYLCQADGSFKGPQTYTPFLNMPVLRPFVSSIVATPSQPFNDGALLVADFDGDGNPDVALLEQEGPDGPAAVFYATGNGDGSFLQHLLRIPTYAPIPPDFLGDIQGKGISGLVQLDTVTSALSAAVGVSNHANFSIEFRALPVSGNEGHLRLLLDAPASTSESFNLSSSNAQVLVPSQVTVPQGATYYDIDFSLGGSFDYTHAFIITVTQGTESHQALGYAVNYGIAAVAITPEFLDFGKVDGEVQSPAQQVTVTNFGSATLTNISLYTYSQFDVISNNCGTTLAAGASCNAQIAVTPKAQDSGRDEAYFEVNGAQGSAAIPLWAITRNAAPTSGQIQVSPSSLNFGTTVDTTSSTQTVTVTNTSNAPLYISSIQRSSGVSETSTCTSQSLSPNQTCAIVAGVSSPTPGAFSGSLTIVSSSVNNPSLNIPVSASFAPLSLKLATGSSSDLTLTAGQSAQETVLVYDGAATTVKLSCNSPVFTCTINPSSITAPANGSGVSVSIQLNGAAASLNKRLNSKLWFAMLFPFVCLLFLPQRRYRYPMSCIAIALCGLVF